MAEQKNQAVKTMYGMWLKNNLDHYRFVSGQARDLQKKLLDLQVNTVEDEEILKDYYIQFCNMMVRNPFIFFLGMESNQKYDIVTYEEEFFLVENQYGVFVPIKFLKENNIPISYSFTDEKKQAEIKAEEIKKWNSEVLGKLKLDVDGLFKTKNIAKKDKFYTALVFLLLCGYFYFSNPAMLQAFSFKNIFQVAGALLICIVLLIFILGIVEYKAAIRLKKAQKDWSTCQALENFIGILPQKIGECDRRLSEVLADKGQNQSSDMASPRKESIVDDISEMHKKITMLASSPKKIQSRVGSFGVVLMVISLAFFYCMQNDMLNEKVKSLNLSAFFEKLGNRDDKNSSPSETLDREKKMVKIDIESAKASSTLKSSKNANYKVQNVLDESYTTSWQEGKKGDGIGEYIRLSFKEDQNVSRIVIVNGNARTEEIYLKNNRLKIARLVFSDGSETEINLEDSYSTTGQTIDLPSPVLTREVSIYIKEVYPGSAYKDTCISGISLYRIAD